MASRIPTSRQVAWISIIPHVIILGIIMYFYFLAGSEEFVIYGSLSYIMLSYGLRQFIPLNHRVGMGLVQKKEFEKAVPYFQKSYDFFSNNSWIDKYRYVTLLTSTKLSYREMALNNIAFCYSQINEREKALEYYNKTLAEYPESEIAKAALNMINLSGSQGSNN